jgi:hypothetical protein
VAENRTNRVQLTDLIYAAEHYLAPRVGFAVGGSHLIFYDPREGRRHVAPDVFIALGVAPGRREKWETWREGGKFPDIVIEITTPSTQEFQFDGEAEVPNIGVVFPRLNPDLHPVAVANWFTLPNPDLVLGGEPVSPRDWLRSGDVALLDLCGLWPARAGGSMAINSGPRHPPAHGRPRFTRRTPWWKGCGTPPRCTAMLLA